MDKRVRSLPQTTEIRAPNSFQLDFTAECRFEASILDGMKSPRASSTQQQIYFVF